MRIKLEKTGQRPWLIWLIVTCALLNGTLYAVLLPLWEGFDEAFHYGYVQELSTREMLPVLGHSALSQEIWDSLFLTPVSHLVRRNMSLPLAFDTYFALTGDERHELRQRVVSIPAAEKYAVSTHGNYEAHQAPLAYLLLAIPDRLMADFSLPARVRILRILAVVLSVLLTATASIALCRQLEIGSPFREVVLLLTFSSQMFYATAAHICNDWLAVPLMSWFIVAAIRFYSDPGVANMSWFALTLALGLLTKAYFGALVPVFLGAVGLAAWRRGCVRNAAIGMLIVSILAGPWYLRNLRLYSSLTAMPEAVAGIGLPEVARGARTVPWTQSIGYMARASLWTGNNNFNAFSPRTLNVVLILLFAGWCYYLASLRKHKTAIVDFAGLTTMGLFILAVAYSTVVSFIYTHGASAGASPWYMQVLLVPAIALMMRGLSRMGKFARVLAVADVLLWTYIILASYFLKLIPLYGGHDLRRIRLADLAEWYLHDGARRNEILLNTALASPHVIYGLLAAVSVLSVLAASAACSPLLNPRKRPIESV